MTRTHEPARLAQAVAEGHFAKGLVAAIAEAAEALVKKPEHEEAHVFVGLVTTLLATAQGAKFA